jgi:hypothetical protein
MRTLCEDRRLNTWENRLSGPIDRRRNNELNYQIAGTRKERLAAFQLVYREYLNAELIAPNAVGVRVTPYHLLPTTNVFVAARQRRTACTVTLIGDGPLGLPMESVYPELVEERRARGLYVGEVSCLAFESMPINQFLLVFLQLTRLMAQYARRYGMDQLLIAVHPQHARFYRRFMGFEQVGPLKAYSSVRDAPAVACCLDFGAIDRWQPKCYSAIFGSPLPKASLSSQPMDDEECSFFEPFVQMNDALSLAASGNRHSSIAALRN